MSEELTKEMKEVKNKLTPRQLTLLTAQQVALPKEGMSTSSWKGLVANYVAGIIVTLLLSKGWIVEADSEGVKAAMIGLIGLIITGLVGLTYKFMDGRAKAVEAKAESVKVVADSLNQMPEDTEVTTID